MRRDDSSPEAYRADVEGPQRELLEAVREAVFDAVPKVEEGIHHTRTAADVAIDVLTHGADDGFQIAHTHCNASSWRDVPTVSIGRCDVSPSPIARKSGGFEDPH